MVQRSTCAHALEVSLECDGMLPWLTFLFLLLGTGEYKIGANYAVAVFPQKTAAELGYVQNLWLHGPEHNLTEVCKQSLYSCGLWIEVSLVRLAR
jgi:hypothetical protein